MKFNRIIAAAFLGAAIGCSLTVQAQTGTVHTMPYSCGFDTTLAVDGWTTIDYNNDGYTWNTNPYGTSGFPAHSSAHFAGSSSYVGGSNGDITPDDFLVSPRIALTGSAVLSWWHRVAASGNPADHYSVYVSTTGNTAADFLATTPLVSITPTSNDYHIWNQQMVDLSAYVGDTVYIAFRHHNCFGQFAILIDDVEVAPFTSPWAVNDTMPWGTNFDTPDTGWTFIGRVNGWYIGALGALNGSGGMYVSGDGGATNSYNRYSWNNRFHWAVRPVHFTDSGDFRVDYDWRCNGYYQSYTYNNQTTYTYYDYVRVMLAPVTAELETERFLGYGITTWTNNLLPAGWISLSDTNGMRLLANEADWTHHAQSFHVPAAGDYLLLVLSANGNSSTVYDVTPAMDNFNISTLTCPNTVDTIRLTANSNQGLTVDWHDTQASEWAVYVNDSLYGTTTDTSFFLAGADLVADACYYRPLIGISPICAAGDTALPINKQAIWRNSLTASRTVSCSPFTLPYSENFDAYLDNDNNQFGWYNLGELGQYTENSNSHSGSLSLNLRTCRIPSGKNTLVVGPEMDAPGNSIMVSFWAKLTTYSGAATDTLLQAGILFNRDTFDYAHVADSTIPMITLRGSDADGTWRYYQFATDSLTQTVPASLTFTLVPHSTSTYNCFVDDISIEAISTLDTVPPLVTIDGPTQAIVAVDTATFTATLHQGDTAGLTYTWHSSLMDTTTFTSQLSPFTLVYDAVGVDTITLIATNSYGSDTVVHLVTVEDNLHIGLCGATTAYVGDTLHYRALIFGGDTANLTYSWHSAMADRSEAQVSILNSQFSILYTTTGTDTLTLTVTNAHGPHTFTRIVTVLSCSTITSFPYSEDFEGYQYQIENRLASWIIRTPEGLLDNEWRRSNGGNNDDGGYHCMYSNGNSTNRAYSAWLITPAIELPQFGDSITFSFALKTQYNDHFAVLLSPTGDPWYDGFTDTLYALVGYTPYLNPWDTLQFSLDAYRGRRIRIAFVHYSAAGSLSNVRIDDISIEAISTLDTVPPLVTIDGPTQAIVAVDTATFTATLHQGDTAGLTYTWHSSLMDTTTFTSQLSPFTLVYDAVGVDTITLIATNSYGSDTVVHLVTVEDNLHIGISGATTAYVGDTLHYRALIFGGDTANLTYSWNSTMAARGEAQVSILNSQFSILYTTTGTDTLTLTVTNAYGPHTITRIVTVLSCSTISSFPYSEDFEGYYWQDRLACWLIRTPEGLLDNEWRRSNGGNDDGGYYCMYSNGNSTNRAFSAWLITPAIELPQFGDSITFSFALKTQYNEHFAVLLSPTGDPYYDGFTDTLYALDGYTPYLNPWDTLQFSLDAYRGRRIRIAFVHYSAAGSLSNVRIDDLAITLNEPPVTHTVSIVSADPTMGTVSGDGEYPDSTLVTITATPFDGYEFLHWDDGDTTNPRQVLVVSDTLFTAVFQAIVDTTTQAITQSSIQAITIYPNPAASDITVSVGQPSVVTVVDLTGRTVLPPTHVSASFLIPHSSLPQGTYFLRCSNAAGTTVRKLIVR